MKQKVLSFLAIVLLLGGVATSIYFLGKARVQAVGSTDLPRPLPYLTHWTQSFADKMLAMNKRGHAVVPTFPSDTAPNGINFQIKTLIETKKLGLPMDMVGTQWESMLYQSPYKDIDRNITNDTFTGSDPLLSDNPNNIFMDNTFHSPNFKLDPLGPYTQIDKWKDVGKIYSGLKPFKFLSEVYPDAQNINLTGNNEAGVVFGTSLLGNSKRFNEKYPNLTTQLPVINDQKNFENRVAGDGWIERYGALFQTWRDNILNEAWKKIKFTAYNGFPDIIFRGYSSANWANGTSTFTTYEGNLLPDTKNNVPRSAYNYYVWDGASPEVYLSRFSDDYHLFGPQFGVMNWVFMIEEARKINPNFYFEISAWDGGANWAASHGFTPERYAATEQYAMWLTRAQAIREFRGNTETWDANLPQFLALTKVVDRVNKQSVLKDFWQNGNLVENPIGHHPWQATAMATGYLDSDIKTKFGVGRWFHLYSNLDQSNRVIQSDGTLGGFKDFDGNAGTNLEIPVFSIALTKGTAPNREWLVYTYSPRQDRSGVVVTVPNFGDITVNSSIAGNFYHLKETDHSANEIKDSASTLTHIILNHKDPIVAPGQTLQFAVAGGKDQYDNDINVNNVVWSATGGTIDQTGLFTAGLTPGEYQLVVSNGSFSEKFNIKVGNLLAYWKMDEASGAYMADSSGRNNACYNNGNWNNAGKFGSNIVLDNNDLGALCDADEYMQTPNEFTLSSWIKVMEGGGGYIGGIYSDGLGKGYYIRFDHNVTTKRTQLAFMGQWVDVPLVEGQWHQVAVEYKASTFYRIYFDGKLIKEFNTNILSSITKGRDIFLIGQKFKGSIDQMKLYNQALSSEEILNLYNEVPSNNTNLTLTKTVDKKSVQVNDLINYTITYQNNGDANIANATIVDNISDRLAIVSAPGAVVNGQVLTWTIPSLAPNSAAQQLTVQCRIKY